VVKYIYKNYLKGKAVAYGFKKRVANLDDDTYLDRDVLQSEYGLLNFNPWYDTFSLPRSIVEPLRRMEESGDLNTDSKIRVATIHSVKGKEADNVVLLPDMTTLTHNNFMKDPDSEHRVFYVGATRAKQQLFLHKPMTDYHYDL
jgi:superfamily I DNA/RNA helicase